MLMLALMLAALSPAPPVTAAPAATPAQQFANYLLDVQQLSRPEHKAVDAHEAALKQVQARKMTDPEFVKVLSTRVIPQYSRFLAALKKVKAPSAEIKQLHKVYINAASAMLKGFVGQRDAVKSGDLARMKDANRMIDRGNKEIGQYLGQVDKLKVKYGLSASPSPAPK